jgi:hypothetical protein
MAVTKGWVGAADVKHAVLPGAIPMAVTKGWVGGAGKATTVRFFFRVIEKMHANKEYNIPKAREENRGRAVEYNNPRQNKFGGRNIGRAENNFFTILF